MILAALVLGCGRGEGAEKAELPGSFPLHAYFAIVDRDTNRVAQLLTDVRKQLAATKPDDVVEQRRWLRLLVVLEMRRGVGSEGVVEWLEKYHDLHGAAEVFDRRMFQPGFYSVPEDARREFWGRLYQAGKLREVDYDFPVLNDVERVLQTKKGPNEELVKFQALKERWLRENPGKWNRPLPPKIGESAKITEAREANFAKNNAQMEEMNRKSMEQMARVAKYTKLKELAATRKHREALEYANSLTEGDLTPGLWENVLYDKCVIAHRLYWQQRQSPEVAKERDGYYQEYVKRYADSPRRKALESVLKLVNFQ